MTGLVLTDDVVKPELDVVLEEQNMRVANNPRRAARRTGPAALYLNHPYGRPVIGWRHEIEKLNRDDALAFYKRFYTPNNAILVVAGRRDVRRGASALARGDLRQGRARHRGWRSARASARRSRSQPPPRTVTLADARVDPAERCSGSYLVPSAHTAKPRRKPKRLDVLAHVLGRRIEQPALPGTGHRPGDRRRCGRLVLRHGARLLADSASARRRKPASACSRSKPRSTPCLPMLIEQGHHRRRSWNARADRLIADAVYAQDNQAALARWYGGALTTGLTVEQVADLAGPHARGHRRSRSRAPPASGSTSAVRSPAICVKDNAASQEKTLVRHRLRTSSTRARFARRRSRAGAVRLHRRPGRRDQDRTGDQPRRHRSLAGARPGRCRWSRWNSPSTAAPARTRWTSPASPI